MGTENGPQIIITDASGECTSQPPDGDVHSRDEETLPLKISPQDFDGEVFLELPPPPDGGWGWVIVVASFMCNLILDGIAYTFGVFLDDFVTYFNQPKAKIAWAGSLLTGVYLTLGPVVSGLTNKFGCRPVTMVGSVIAFGAFALSALSPTAEVLIITYGVCGGIGFGLIYLPAIVSVGYYFDKKRALATGISVCGSGIGTFAFAPLGQALLENYGWQGANLILAGLILNCLIFGALMRPLQAVPIAPEENPDLMSLVGEEKYYKAMYGSHDSAYFTVQKPDGTCERTALRIPLNNEPGVNSNLNLHEDSPMTPMSLHTLPTITEARPLTEQDIEEQKHLEHEMHKISNASEDDKDTQVIFVPSPEKPAPNGTIGHPPQGFYLRSNVPSSGTQPPTAIPAHISPRPSLKGFFNQLPEGFPRNGSHPALVTAKGAIPKNVSMPQFDQMRHRLRAHSGIGSMLSIEGTSRRGSLMQKSSLSIYSIRRSRRNSSVCSQRSEDSLWIHLPDGSRTRKKLPRSRRSSINPLHRKDAFYTGDITQLKEYRSTQDLTTYRQNVISLNPISNLDSHSQLDYPDSQVDYGAPTPEPTPKSKFSCVCFPESCWEVMRTMMDWSLLRNPVFMVISISNVLGMLGFYVPFVFMIDAAVIKGVDATKAAFLISIIGITNTVGRILSGIIADIPWINAFFVNNLSILLTGITVFCTPFASEYIGYCCVAVAFGLFSSAYIALTSIVLVELLGLEKLTNSFGLLILFRGGACMVGPPLAGSVYDASGSYDLSFFFGGIMLILSAILSFLAPCAKRFTRPVPEVQNIVEDEDAGIFMNITKPSDVETTV